MSAAGRFAQPFADFEILGRLGSGGMGTVFRARRKIDDVEVAIKVLRPSLSRNSRYVERLRREAEISMRLDHPALVKGFGFGEEGGYHFVVMEFCPGRTLRALLKAWGRFPEDQVLDLGVQVAEALAYAHENGVVHRDVKPGNLLIDEEGNTKLTDLGLAKAESDPTLTRDGGTVGTPQYMSPEQAESPTSVDERSDLYSLGATLYHMLVGQPPFAGESAVQVIAKLLHERADSAGALNPDVSEGLNLVLRRLLMKKPADRYATARELLEDLRAVQRGAAPAIDARALAKAEGADTPRVRTMRVVIAAAVGVVVALAGVWIWNATQSGSSSPAPKIGFETLKSRVFEKARDFRSRFALLDDFEVADEGERVEVQAMRQQLLRRFETELTAFHDSWTRDRLERWLGGHGSQYRADFVAEQELSLQRRFRGYRAKSLPPDLRSLHESLQGAELRILGELDDARVASAIGRARETLTTSVFPKLERLAQKRDFAAATRLLEDLIRAPTGLLAAEGAGQTSLLQAERFAVVIESMRTKRDAIVERARRLVVARRRRIEDGIDEARRMHRSGFSERAARILDGLEREIDERRPWVSLPPAVREDREALLSSIVRDRRAVQDELQRLDLEAMVLAEDAVHARLAKDLDVDAALGLVSGYRFATRDGEELRKDLVTDLKRLRKFLLQVPALLAPADRTRASTWHLRDGSVDAVLHERVDGPPPQFVLRIRGSGVRSVDLSDFESAWLAERCLRGEGAAQNRVALGLLLFYLDRFDRAFQYLGDHRIQRLPAAARRRQAILSRSAESADDQASSLLARIRDVAQRPGVLAHNALSAMLQDLETRLADTRVVRDASEELEQFRVLLRLEKRRLGLVEALEAQLREACRIELPRASELRLSLDLREAGVLESGLGSWRKTSLGLEAPPAIGVRPEEEFAQACTLRFPVLETRSECQLELELALPVRGRPAEVLECEIFGSRVLLVTNLGDGGRILANPSKDLRKALASASAQPALRALQFVEGGRAQLRFELGEVERDARMLRVYLDGEAVDGGGLRVDVARSGAASIRLAGIGDVALQRVLLRGRAR